jgi:hypothetical protein
VSVWPNSTSQWPSLVSAEGTLVSVHITVDPWMLEELLDALARVSFPINPEIQHGVPLRVEFPAYASRLEEVRSALRGRGFAADSMTSRDMLAEISDREF